MVHQDTICALSTAPGTGAIAVVRLSGSDALRIAQQLDPRLLVPMAREARLVRLQDSDGVIDECVLTWFQAPHSYTGEHVVELAIHGSPYIQQRLLEALTARGARLARPGEFTQRAYLNGKLDLSQAEAVADLIASESRAAHKLALHQLRGGYSRRIDDLREQLIGLSALVELELDFGEEDVEFADRTELMRLANEIIGVCDGLIASFRFGNAVKRGVPVAIVGAPNSGKSTLLNALLQEDRAIVSDIPGTTRDTIEETLVIDGVLFRFIDTAGIRQATDTVEKLGIERSYRKATEADIVVYLGDAGSLSEDAFRTQAGLLRARIGEGPEIVPVLNKSDLAQRPARNTLSISARTGEGLDALRARFLEHVTDMGHTKADIVVTNARHVDALTKARDALVAARSGVEQRISGELLAADLRRAQEHLGEITGRITPDDLLGSIFSRFCIGK